ncbi:MAG: hypothetical protein K6L80_06065 [Agarilytica sp.]
MFTASRYFLLALSLISLSACQSIVRTDISTFRSSDTALPVGTILITGKDASESKSLEFRYYRNKLAERLAALGYTPVDSADAKFKAVLSYGVLRQEKDEPQSRVIIGGTFGYYPFYPRGSILVSDLNDTEFEFVRDVSLSIESLGDEKSKVIEIKASSIGRCEHLTVVYDEILDAIFSDVLRPNGSVQKVRVEGTARCP